MPRIDGVFQLLPGTYGEPDTTIKSVPYNSQLDDFTNEMNGARPIGAGGTGATSAAGARSNLGLVITTSATDTTAGRITKVGDFGLGGAVDSGTIDFDTVYYGFHANSSTANYPSNNPTGVAASRWAGLTLGNNNSRLQLVARTDASMALYYRAKNTSSFWPWKTVANLEDAQTFQSSLTLGALLNANANITIDNSNPRIFFNDTNDGGMTTVGPFASGSTFRIEVDEAQAIANSAFVIRVDAGNRFSVTNTGASFSVPLSVAGNIDATGTFLLTNTGPTIQLNDSSVSNLSHLFRSFSDDVTIDGDVSNVFSNSLIRLRLDGAGVGYINSTGDFVSQGVNGNFATNAAALAGDTSFDDNGACFGFSTGPAIMSRRLASGGSVLSLNRALSSGDLLVFRRSATQVGSVSVNTTNATYNTSSDYRLKYGLADLDGSGAFIDALKPYRGKWIVDDSDFVGFLAHEFAEVSPSSVQGEKDAMIDIGVAWPTDENGAVLDFDRAVSNIPEDDIPEGWSWAQTGTRPVYQTMQASSSEVIANVVAELQSLRRRVGALEH